MLLFLLKTKKIRMEKLIHCIDLDILKLIEKHDIPYDKHNLLGYASCFGYFDMVKWLYDRDDTSNKNQYVFETSCEGGQLHIAKWIYGPNIEIQQSHNHTFAWACVLNHINIIDWLLGLDITILYVLEDSYNMYNNHRFLDIVSKYEIDINLIGNDKLRDHLKMIIKNKVGQHLFNDINSIICEYI